MTAALTPPIGRYADQADDTLHIPLHKLKGDRRVWADRLLSLFKDKPIDGVEWSMKFSAEGVIGNRFMLGIQREHWRSLNLAALSQALSLPQALWMRVQQDMEQAQAMYFAFEPGPDSEDTYRIYLEFLPAPAVLREQGALPLGCGYKWHPATGKAAAITTYRMRYLEDRDAFNAHLSPFLLRLSPGGGRHFAERVIKLASTLADPGQFMFLEVDEAGGQRDSFTVTFRGLALPLRRIIPDLLQLASSLAINESDVLAHLVPDEPRSLYSLAAGVGRDGHEFMTVYYD